MLEFASCGPKSMLIKEENDKTIKERRYKREKSRKRKTTKPTQTY